jgi:hypothetical protein
MLAEIEPSIRSRDADGADWLRFRLIRSALDTDDAPVITRLGTSAVISDIGITCSTEEGGECY